MTKRVLFRQALAAMRVPGFVLCGVGFLVMLPATIPRLWVFWIVALLTIYPLFLLGCYCFAGWHLGTLFSGVTAPLPRWQIALALGGGGGLRLTLMAVIGGLLGSLVVGGILSTYSAIDSMMWNPGTAGGTVGLFLLYGGALLLPILLAGLFIGTPCAWGTAYFGLGRRIASPSVAANAEAVPFAPRRD